MSINGFGVSGKPLGHQWEIGTIAFGETRLSGVRREHQGVPSGVFEFCPHHKPHKPGTWGGPTARKFSAHCGVDNGGLGGSGGSGSLGSWDGSW